MPRSGGLKSPAKVLSRSAPTSPKNLKDLTKSSTLPPPRSVAIEMKTSSVVAVDTGDSSSGVSASPRKSSRNATFSNFFKKLSPKLRQSGSSSSSSSSAKSRDKNWYVVEIAQADVDGQPVPRDRAATRPDLREPGSSSVDVVPVPSTSSKRQTEVTTVPRVLGSSSLSSEAQVQQVNASFGTRPVIRINSSGSAPATTTAATGGETDDGAAAVQQPSGPRVRRTHQPPRTLNIQNKIVVQHPYEADRAKGKMASVESIGSCSLDVDATASESSATADGRASSVSQRTLHSASVDLGSEVSNVIVGGGLRTESLRSPRSPTRTSSVKNSVGVGSGSDVRYISELYIPNGRVRSTEEDHNDQRKPSYISISCSVSGYTSYSCYNSKVREGLRSRDNSPARLAFTTVANGGSNSQLTGLDFGGQEQEIGGASPTVHTNSVLLDVNGGAIDVVDRSSRRSMYEETTTTTSYSTLWRASSEDGLLSHQSNESEIRSYRQKGSENRVERVVTTNGNEGIFESESINNNNRDEEHGERKSLIQQRIERLYGPSALAQGFRLHRERRHNSEKSTIPKSSEVNSYPPVFKHLCPTFYDQLVTSYSSSPITSPLKSIDHIHSPKTSAISDIKTKETAAKEIRINGDVSKQNGFHSETPEMLKRPPKEVLVVENADVDLGDSESAVKDGKWFIEIMNGEQSKIKVLILRAEEHLMSDSPPEEACGRLRAAIGKANLLLSQKFQQFRGLCEKNLTQLSSEPFPTTVSDLAGFWDMVLIQVQDIHKMFEDIETMRDRGWLFDEKDDAATKAKQGGDTLALTAGVKIKRSAVKKPATVSTAQRSTKADEAARAREEARKRLLEAKRKGRQQATANDNSVIEIFVAEDKD